MRTISVQQRRQAVVRRHHLGGTAETPQQVTRALLALHASDPASVYLSVLSRSTGSALADVSAAMYEQRSLVRWMAMRRTLFLFDRADIPMVQAAISTPLAATLRRRLISQLDRNGTEPPIEGDAGQWLAGLEARVERALRARGTATGAQLSADEPALRTFIPPRVPSDRPRNVTSALLTLMSTQGRLVRGTPTGSWTSRHHRWEPVQCWWPDGLPQLGTEQAQRELAKRWLTRFGPATAEDLQWWTGWNKTTTQRVLSGIAVEDVDLHGEAGIALGPDNDPPGVTGPPAATLLPALDPTPMGWKHRGWLFAIPEHHVFDNRGNIGPTVWWDGEIIGAWAITPAGEIRTAVLADRGSAARTAVEGAAARLQERLGGAIITPAIRAPLERSLTQDTAGPGNLADPGQCPTTGQITLPSGIRAAAGLLSRERRRRRSAMSTRPLHFSAFIWPNGYHESAWRVVPDDVRGVLGLPYYADIARTAERGLMDAIFLADNIAIAEYRATYLPQTQFDPISVLSALAAVTSRIGLIGTGSTTYSKPWELARRFATLDHLSAGRAGWNIVTTVTPLAAANFGEPFHPDHADRYARAHEFVDVVQRAWDSWGDGAVIGDRERGVWADRSQLHAPHFHGQYYDSEGVLPFPRSPQGHPVLVQAGQSAAGIGLAARYAELVFSGPPSLEAAVAFRSNLHAQVTAAGRDPEQVFVLPALMVTLGGTEAEAQRRARQLEELMSPEFRWQNALYTAGLDPDAFDPDEPLPAELWTGRSAPSSRAEQLFAAAQARPHASLREITQQVTGGAGQSHFVGTPEQLADHITAWQDAGAVDGFTIMGSTLPYELTAFVDQVVPILQRRGRFRTEYTGHTLRDHLGLQRPVGHPATRLAPPTAQMSEK